jgi:hypothetical protein
MAFTAIIHASIAQKPPYSGTIFFDKDIVSQQDSSTIDSITYVGRGLKLVYDRRVNNWININAYLFRIKWNDGLTSQAVVNPEFTLQEATIQAEKYGFSVGQLPKILRTDVNELWIHKGLQPFGGGNKSILIHTEQATQYEKDGILEETLIHEAAHTSLDANHAKATEWVSAQQKDGNFISTYAQQYPDREDIAETFLTWIAVRHRASRISQNDYNLITTTIPNRLQYFDKQNFNLNPIKSTITSSESFELEKILSLYPNPTTGLINIISHNNGQDYKIEIHSSDGHLLEVKQVNDNTLDLSSFPKGIYFISDRNNRQIRVVKL